MSDQPRRPPRVLLMSLSVRTSARGTAYLSGYLGRAKVVAFAGEADRWGNPTWDVFVSEPEPRPDERRDERRARELLAAAVDGNVREGA